MQVTSAYVWSVVVASFAGEISSVLLKRWEWECDADPPREATGAECALFLPEVCFVRPDGRKNAGGNTQRARRKAPFEVSPV